MLNSLLGIARQWSLEKFAILSLEHLSHVSILILVSNVGYLGTGTMFDARERVVPRRAAAVQITSDSFSWYEHSLNLMNVIFWNVIHINLIRVPPPSPFTRAFSLSFHPTHDSQVKKH